MPDGGVNNVSGASSVAPQASTSQATKLTLSAGETKTAALPSNGQPGVSGLMAEVTAKLPGMVGGAMQKIGLGPKVEVSIQQRGGSEQGSGTVSRDPGPSGNQPTVGAGGSNPPGGPPSPPPTGGAPGAPGGAPGGGPGDIFNKMEQQTAAQNMQQFEVQMKMADHQHKNAMMIAEFQGIRNEHNRVAEALTDHASDAMTRGKNAQQKLSQSASA